LLIFCVSHCTKQDNSQSGQIIFFVICLAYKYKIFIFTRNTASNLLLIDKAQLMAWKVKRIFNQIVSGSIKAVEYYENSIIRKDGSKRIIAWHNSILYVWQRIETNN